MTVRYVTRLNSQTVPLFIQAKANPLPLPLTCSKPNLFFSLCSRLSTTPTTNGNYLFKEQALMSLLKRCSSMKHVSQLHAQVIKSGFHNNLFLVGKIIVFCAVSMQGDMDYAVSVFERIENPDGFLWNTMIRGFGKTSQPKFAFEYYKRMQYREEVADNFTFCFLLKICGQLGLVLLGMQIHCEIIKRSLESHVFVRNTLIHMYGLFRDINTASQLFEEIPTSDLVAWNTIIDCHVCCSRYKDALDLFLRMLGSGIRPDEATLVVSLAACSALGALDFGRWMHHSCIKNTGLGDVVSVNNALVDMYAKCGAVEEAYESFHQMREKSIITWNTMILGLAIHGKVDKALTLFDSMLAEKLERPDDVTFLGVLWACSHRGMVDEGRTYFDIMRKNFHIQPTIKHYGCIVDLLGRAGLVDEAYQLIMSMPIECNAIVWRTLLAACQVHGNVELGKKIRQHLLEVEPDHSSDFVLLANMYASAGQWNEVLRVRKSMKNKGVQKPEPGNSFIGIH